MSDLADERRGESGPDGGAEGGPDSGAGRSPAAPDVLAMDGWGSTGGAVAAYAPNGANGHAPEAAPIPEPIPALAPAGGAAEQIRAGELAESGGLAGAGALTRVAGRAELVRVVRRVAPVGVAVVLAAGALLSWRVKPAGGERLTPLSQLPQISARLAGQKGPAGQKGEGAGLDQGSFDELRRRLAELIAPEPPEPPPPLHRRWLDRLGGPGRG